MTVTDEIKSRIDIVELVSQNVKLRRTGKNYTGFCPFHPNSKTPAFVVFPESGTWRCFGQCNEGGDIFRYVMKKEGWDFAGALRHLAEKAGVELEPLTPEKKEEDQQHERLRTLMEQAVTFYRHHLTGTPAGARALEYLHQRGLQDSAMEAFGLGYAPDSWEAALQYFTAKGYTTQELLDTGLLTERKEENKVYDRFRNRIMFPIRDGNGRMTGFGARILNPDDVPKFLNSPQTVLFDKGRLLYGLDRARKAIRTEDRVVIVEGYLDVIALHQSGFANAVSPMGTALNEEQLRTLKRITRRITLALDADAAGEKATLRGLDVARQALDHTGEVTAGAGGIFDARGLVRQEARLQADLRVTTLPAGADPDDVVLRDPQEWARIVEAAKPVVVHVMETLSAGRNLEDAKVKSEIAAQVLPLIEDVPNPIERDTYRQQLARLLRVDEQTLVGRTQSQQPSRRSRRQPSTENQRQIPAVVRNEAELILSLEQHILALLINKPDALYALDRALQQAGLGRFSDGDFEQAYHQVLARLVQQSLEQDVDETHIFIAENTPGELTETLNVLATAISSGTFTSDQLVEDLIRTVMRLRKTRILNGIAQLRFLQQDLQDQGENSFEAYLDMVQQHTQTLGRLNQALGQPVLLN